MPRKRFTPEQIITKLREAEIHLSKGQKVVEVCRQLEVSANTYYRWRKEYGGLEVNQARRLKQLCYSHWSIRIRSVDPMQVVYT